MIIAVIFLIVNVHIVMNDIKINDISATHLPVYAMRLRSRNKGFKTWNLGAKKLGEVHIFSSFAHCCKLSIPSRKILRQNSRCMISHTQAR